MWDSRKSPIQGVFHPESDRAQISLVLAKVLYQVYLKIIAYGQPNPELPGHRGCSSGQTGAAALSSQGFLGGRVHFLPGPGQALRPANGYPGVCTGYPAGSEVRLPVSERAAWARSPHSAPPLPCAPAVPRIGAMASSLTGFCHCVTTFGRWALALQQRRW